MIITIESGWEIVCGLGARRRMTTLERENAAATDRRQEQNQWPCHLPFYGRNRVVADERPSRISFLPVSR